MKSLRQGQASIAEAYAMVKNGQMYLLGAHIPEYAQGNVHNHEPTRERKLLLHKKEIQKWHARVKEKGVTIVPLSLYFKGSRAKLEIALCKGKKLYDKREDKRSKEDCARWTGDVARRARAVGAAMQGSTWTRVLDCLLVEMGAHRSRPVSLVSRSRAGDLESPR